MTHAADGDPINDPGARLTAMVTYGDQEQEFALTPTYDAEAGTGTPGEYAALVIPTAPGDYTFHVTGKVEGVKVDLKVTSSPKTFSPVEDASAVQFPVKVPATGQVAERLDKELPRLATAAKVGDVESQVVEREDPGLRRHRRRRGGHRTGGRRAAPAPARLKAVTPRCPSLR